MCMTNGDSTAQPQYVQEQPRVDIQQPHVPVPAREETAYRDLMVEIYKAHNPDKLDQVDILLAEKYKGQERKMYELVCKKYSVPAKPDARSLTRNSTVGNFCLTGALADVSDMGAVEDINHKDLMEMRGMKRPPSAVRCTLELTCLLVAAPKQSTRKDPWPPTWASVQKAVADDAFVTRVLKFEVAALQEAPLLVAFLKEEYFGQSAANDGKNKKTIRLGFNGEPEICEPLTFARVKRANRAAATLFTWCQGVLENVGAFKVPEPIAPPAAAASQSHANPGVSGAAKPPVKLMPGLMALATKESAALSSTSTRRAELRARVTEAQTTEMSMSAQTAQLLQADGGAPRHASSQKALHMAGAMVLSTRPPSRSQSPPGSAERLVRCRQAMETAADSASSSTADPSCSKSVPVMAASAQAASAQAGQTSSQSQASTRGPASVAPQSMTEFAQPTSAYSGTSSFAPLTPRIARPDEIVDGQVASKAKLVKTTPDVVESKEKLADAEIAPATRKSGHADDADATPNEEPSDAVVQSRRMAKDLSSASTAASTISAVEAPVPDEPAEPGFEGYEVHVKFPKNSFAMQWQQELPLEAVVAMLTMRDKLKLRILSRRDANEKYEMGAKRLRFVKQYFFSNEVECDAQLGPVQPVELFGGVVCQLLWDDDAEFREFLLERRKRWHKKATRGISEEEPQDLPYHMQEAVTWLDEHFTWRTTA